MRTSPTKLQMDPRHFRPKRHIVVSALVGMAIGQTAAAAATPAPVLVVPAGDKDGFAPALKASAALVDHLNREGRTPARLGYFLPKEEATPVDTVQAAAAYDRALRAFEMLDFEVARSQCSTALELYKALIAAGKPAKGYVDTLHLLAATELFDGNQHKALGLMTDAIVFSDRPPSPRIFNPTVQDLHKRALAHEEQSSLTVSCKPDALIWLNRELRGPANKTFHLPAGLYWVRIFRPGHAPWLEWIRVKPNRPQQVSAQLAPAPVEESALQSDLRKSTRAPAPTRAVAYVAKKTGAQQVVIVAPEGRCTSTSCTLAMRWAYGKRWIRQGRGVYAPGKSRALVSELLGIVPPVADAVAKQAPVPMKSRCQTDSDCPIRQQCTRGYCERETPLVEKWWFWTIIGVAAAGAATAIALPLTRPDAPVIEVR